MSDLVKFVVFVPVADADNVRLALGKAGAGKIGNYDFCTFSSLGMGRFLPKEGASPAIGEVGKIERVEEERIETVVPRELLSAVIEAVKEVHPYEEVAFDVYSLESV